jgi:adenylate cyclase
MPRADGAVADLRIALQLNSNDARNQLRYGYVLMAIGRLSEAGLALEKAIEHDPLFPPAWYWLGRLKAAQGDYTGASRAMHRVLAINPDYSDASSYLGILALLQGDAGAARDIFTKLDSPWNLAMAEHDLGQLARARRTLETFIAKHSNDQAYQIAQAYAWFGDNDEAFKWVKRAILQRDHSLSMVNRDPLMHGLQNDPRFAATLREVSLPPRAARETTTQSGR